MSMTRVS